MNTPETNAGNGSGTVSLGAIQRALKNPRDGLYFIFDVESIGLHGEGFAVGWVARTETIVYEEGLLSCDPSFAAGEPEDRKWCDENISPIELTNERPRDVRKTFWRYWTQWKRDGAVMAADCCWPVEARFLIDCIKDDPNRANDGPYPLIDIGSMMLMAGINPLTTFDRLPTEMPKHCPLADAKQSARLLFEILKKGAAK